MTIRFFCDLYHNETEILFYENVSRLVTRPNILSHLQDLKLDEGEKTVSFQWLGPHFLTLLNYATELTAYFNQKERSRPFHFVTKLCLCFNYEKKRFLDLLKRLDDSASDCILYGETEHYKNFLEITLSFMPQIREFFTIQMLERSFDADDDGNYTIFHAIFIDFILETIGELQNCPTYSSVLVSNQVKVLQKELNFLLTLLVDDETQTKNILEEIEDVFNEAGLFLHSFFFTTDLVTATKMDLEVFDLLERIEIVKVKIKYQCIAVSMEMNCGIRSLQAVESSSEVSSSQDKSIPMVEEMIVGFDDMTTQIVDKLLGGPNYRQVISITGMGGLGKTTLAKQIYNHSSVRDYFDKLSWCVVSQTYQKRKLLIDILRSISDLKEDEISEMKYEKLAEALYRTLFGRRYLIVMDDLWDIHAWNDLNRYFPQDTYGSRVLITSREKNVASKISQVIIEPPPLSPGESWNLLEQKVFKKERCPQELQAIGKQIATNCHGLPLSVVLIAGVLSNMEKKESLWQQVEKKMHSYISQKADDYIPSLKLSYMHLPDHLKPCFLYLSAFQEDEKIPIRKLFSLWIAEGFIVRKEQTSFEDVAEEYLMELINRSLLQVSKRRSDNGVKACTLHDLVLDMCRKIAVEDESFLFQHQFLMSKHRHRLCIDPSHNLSEALSILYNSEKTRIFESRHNNFAKLGFKIMHDLRYLKIGFFTSSIGRFRNLEVLIINTLMDLLIPAFLLNMPKLRHLCVGSPGDQARFSMNCYNSRINNLETLRYVYIKDSMDEIILSQSPNLRMLKFTCPKTYCANLDFLTQLESLTMIYEFNSLYSSMLVFPSNIKKLHLVGINLKSEKLSLIGTLPKLEILKLTGALQENSWTTKDNDFQKLKFLKLSLYSLTRWNSSHNHFPVLERLVLSRCKVLKMIPLEFSYIPTLLKVELYYCGKTVESSALKILEEKQNVLAIWD